MPAPTGLGSPADGAGIPAVLGYPKEPLYVYLQAANDLIIWTSVRLHIEELLKL